MRARLGTYAVLIFVVLAKPAAALLEDVVFNATYETLAVHSSLFAPQTKTKPEPHVRHMAHYSHVCDITQQSNGTGHRPNRSTDWGCV